MAPPQLLTAADFPPLKNDLILRAAKGEKVERTPVWIMRQAGRYLPEFREARKRNDFFTICRTPELACEVTLQPIDRYEGLLDASIIFSDILVVPQAMGMEVQMLEKVGPHFPKPLKTPEDLSLLITNPDIKETLGYVMDAITLTRTKLDGRVPLIGFTGAPWTLMAYMIEGGGSKTYSKAKTWLYKYSEASKELLGYLTDVCVNYLVAQVKAGAQMLQVFDSNAGELAPAEFNEFVLPGLLDIASRVKAQLKDLDLEAPIVIFARNAEYALEDLNKSQYDVVQVGFTLAPSAVRKIVKKKTVQGNADPSLLYAPVEKIKSAVEEMLDGFGTGSGYIANLGHGMYPDHDPEHLKAYLTAIKEYSTAKNANTPAAKKRKAAKESEASSPAKKK
ncbi:Uroporphyrinogen decarboxylase [Obelidium mucronatum]|nr:Uroporphyrinogen decarboxylase [Obelidium mucronatum]